MEFFTKKVKILMIGAICFSCAHSYMPQRNSSCHEIETSAPNATLPGPVNYGAQFPLNRSNDNKTADDSYNDAHNETASDSKNETMMQQNIQTSSPKPLPWDCENWGSMREHGMVYVDKTMFLLNLRDFDTRLIFFTRPRLFGKTFFVATLESYFMGEKHLFVGTEIFKFGNCRNNTWIKYPVIRLDMSKIATVSDFVKLDMLETAIHLSGRTSSMIRNYLSFRYNLHESFLDNSKLELPSIISYLRRKYNAKVVILIDEYDSLINHAVYTLNNADLAKKIAYFFNELFRQIKSCSRNIKLAWVTGVNALASQDLTSGPNSFVDLTYDAKYATVAGFTINEISRNFDFYVANFAKAIHNPTDKIMEQLKFWYDGYNFNAKHRTTHENSTVYNPISIINSLKDHKFRPYWAETGSVKYIVEQIYNRNFLWYKNHTILEEDVFSKRYSHYSLPPWLLMLIHGYLTFGDYDAHSKTYTLMIPNNEVKYYLIEKILDYVPKLNCFIYEYDAIQHLNALTGNISNPNNFGQVVDIINELGFINFKNPLNTIHNEENDVSSRISLFFHNAGIEYDERILRSGKLDIGELNILTNNLMTNYAIKVKFGNPREAVKQILQYFLHRYKAFYHAIGNETEIYLTALNFLKARGSSTKIIDWVVIPCVDSDILMDQMIASSPEMREIAKTVYEEVNSTTLKK